MAISWNAEGLLRPVWSSLGVSDGRDELARRTGIPATNLSSINSGKRPLTLEAARRIADAADVSVLELGAPLEVSDLRGETLLDRLQSLEERHEELRRQVLEVLRLRELEDQLSTGRGAPRSRESRPRGEGR